MYCMRYTRRLCAAHPTGARVQRAVLDACKSPDASGAGAALVGGANDGEEAQLISPNCLCTSLRRDAPVRARHFPSLSAPLSRSFVTMPRCFRPASLRSASHNDLRLLKFEAGA